jgi:pimeloyl-ACP methyl ester carboxylesterase
MLVGCSVRPMAFRVVKPGAAAEFALESPVNKKSRETVAFSKLMERQYGFVAGRGYLDLLPGMRVTAQRAYFRGSEVKLSEYLGSETGRWNVEPGVRFRFMGSEAERGLQKPADAPAIGSLIGAGVRRLRLYRMFFQVRWFAAGREAARGSVILGAATAAALEAATAALMGEKPVACGAQLDCIPFPAATTVTTDVGVEVNGELRWAPWGSTVKSIAPSGAGDSLHVERRLGKKRLAPVEFARGDEAAWLFPLLPGDRLRWSAAAGSSVAERVVTGGGAPIAFDSRGNGDTALVFVHGWASDRSVWREQADAFARDYRVVTLDLTGHGRFAPPAPPRFVLTLAGDVEAVVRDLGLRRVILVGHSMGGAIALAAAKRLSGIARGVVLVTPEIPKVDGAALWADFKGTMEELIRTLVVGEQAKSADAATAVILLRNWGTIDFDKLKADAGVPVQTLNVPAKGQVPQLERPAEFNLALRGLLAGMK